MWRARAWRAWCACAALLAPPAAAAKSGRLDVTLLSTPGARHTATTARGTGSGTGTVTGTVSGTAVGDGRGGELSAAARMQRVLQQFRAASPRPALRERPARLPSAAELDLSPARGALVHSLRIKNRLCHRHVMVPEGPKYDSRGKPYLSAHARSRDYALTSPPRLLLPRCCNCCRKSALGCQ